MNGCADLLNAADNIFSFVLFLFPGKITVVVCLNIATINNMLNDINSPDASNHKHEIIAVRRIK
jgi:hypothetical protein